MEVVQDAENMALPHFTVEKLERFRDAMLAQPQHQQWAKALATWSCPTEEDGSCDPCGSEVGAPAGDARALLMSAVSECIETPIVLLSCGA